MSFSYLASASALSFAALSSASFFSFSVLSSLKDSSSPLSLLVLMEPRSKWDVPHAVARFRSAVSAGSISFSLTDFSQRATASSPTFFQVSSSVIGPWDFLFRSMASEVKSEVGV